jgi:thiamine biosynthesis lipoprotein
MRRVFETMGTIVSLEASNPSIDLRPVFAEFDARFSLYEPASELSRIASGALPLREASTEALEAYATALDWRSATHGAFTPHRPDGVIDLSGIVKAIAMDAAARLLAGSGTWVLNVGGDVVTSGHDVIVGIVDPLDRAQLLTAVKLSGSRRAVATSGSAERGDHIWGRGRFTQVSVVADDIVTADVLATAIVAGGRDTLDDSTSNWNIDVLAIDDTGNLVATPGFVTSMTEAAHAA